MTIKTTYHLRALAVLVALALAAGLLAGEVRRAEAAFPGKNGKIVFESFRNANYEIYSMNPNGTTPVNLTQNLKSDFDPAVSPDGKKIAFWTDRKGDGGEVYVMNALDGSMQQNRTNTAAYDAFPDWAVATP
jgi:Tol biopolymer transport system component